MRALCEGIAVGGAVPHVQMGVPRLPLRGMSVHASPQRGSARAGFRRRAPRWQHDARHRRLRCRCRFAEEGGAHRGRSRVGLAMAMLVSVTDRRRQANRMRPYFVDERIRHEAGLARVLPVRRRGRVRQEGQHAAKRALGDRHPGIAQQCHDVLQWLSDRCAVRAGDAWPRAHPVPQRIPRIERALENLGEPSTPTQEPLLRSPLACTATMAAVEVCLVDRDAPAHQLQTESLLSTARVGAPGLRHCARRHVASVISITLPPDHETAESGCRPSDRPPGVSAPRLSASRPGACSRSPSSSTTRIGTAPATGRSDASAKHSEVTGNPSKSRLRARQRGKPMQVASNAAPVDARR